jgi:hypothetical protein
MSGSLDLLDLDRQVERAALDTEKTRESMVARESPLEAHRRVSGTRTIDGLFELSPPAIEAPLRDALAAWVVALLMERLAYPAWRSLTDAKRAPRVIPPTEAAREGVALVTWEDAWGELLESSESGAAAWIAALADAATEVAGAAREARARLKEVNDRVLEKLEKHSGPAWKTLGQPLPPSQAASLAETVLAVTDDLSRDLQKADHRRGEKHFGAASHLIGSLGRDAASSFPARIRPRWFREIFGDNLRGLRVAVFVPSRMAGASTFARALAGFGRAVRNAVDAPDLPFSLRASPYGLDAERFATIFAGLAADRTFLRKALGVTPNQAKEDRRSVARSLLLGIRGRAARIVLDADESRFEEVTKGLFGAPLPAPLAGAWPLPRNGDARRFVGAIEALPLGDELVERFDEDWFRNPRAFDWMRNRGHAPATSYDTGQWIEDVGTVDAAHRMRKKIEGLLG